MIQKVLEVVQVRESKLYQINGGGVRDKKNLEIFRRRNGDSNGLNVVRKREESSIRDDFGLYIRIDGDIWQRLLFEEVNYNFIFEYVKFEYFQYKKIYYVGSFKGLELEG